MDRMSRLAMGWVAALALATFVWVPTSAMAQIHAHGSAWIERNAAQGTILHAMDDTLCTFDFPADCMGGMMAPDSIYCAVEILPLQEMPPASITGVSCDVTDPDGMPMMSGHMTPGGLFHRSVDLTIPYAPEMLSARKIAPQDLVLTTWSDGAYTIVDGATHDVANNLFHLSTTRLASVYAIADRTALPVGAVPSTWGALKTRY